MKKIIIKLLALSSLVGGFIYSNSVLAVSYQKKVDVSFTFQDVLSVSVSSPNLVISDLAPGSISDSNEIIVTVLSNNRTGYVLNSSVGSSTSPYSSYGRNLINSNIGTSGASNTLFSSLDYSTAPATTALTTPSTWGYQYATSSSDDDNGNVVYNDWSNYNGLPLYSDTTNVATLNSNSGPSLSTGDKLKFRIGAYADTTQLSGEYTNLINFTAVANATPTTLSQAFYEAAQNDPSITKLDGYYKMQDMSAAICSAVQEIPSEMPLIDVRDNNVYRVAKLADNRCWMVQNIRFAEPTLDSSTSNVASTYTASNPLTINWLELKTDSACYYDGSSGKGWVNTCMHKPDTDDLEAVSSLGYTSEELGAWYNYAGLTVGTIVGSRNTTKAQYSICPLNWGLPSDVDSNGDFYALKNALGSSVQQFHPLYGGDISSGNLRNPTTVGAWYSSIANSVGNHRLGLYFTNNSLSSMEAANYDGKYVRCIANNE